MLRLDNDNGIIAVDDTVLSNIVSIAAGNCFGISGMTAKNVTEEFWELVNRDPSDKGISVRCSDNKIEVDLHIMVLYGINIPAITDSITHKITYTLEEMTGFEVSAVNIYVDSVTK
ncbi:MAG: Asp23/Gls24 family envelope stress response protein [Clostridia bacterium]|nr:Asp23/Gls24 family envelope stress response protein [Clostridia bacterium]